MISFWPLSIISLTLLGRVICTKKCHLHPGRQSPRPLQSLQQVCRTGVQGTAAGPVMCRNRPSPGREKKFSPPANHFSENSFCEEPPTFYTHHSWKVSLVLQGIKSEHIFTQSQSCAKAFQCTGLFTPHFTDEKLRLREMKPVSAQIVRTT